MTHNHDFFTPNNVDEQVEQLSQGAREGRLPRGEQAGARLVENLQAYYQSEQQDDSASLERAWQRVSVSLIRNREHAQSLQVPLPATTVWGSQERTRTMRNHIIENPRRGNIARRLSVLAAVLVAALLVGGLIAVMSLNHRAGTSTASTIAASSTAAPAVTTQSLPANIGKTLYTTSANQWGFNGLSWSPDSKRIASSTVDLHGVQIWDGTTGDHLVTVQLPGGTSEWAYGLDWSPAGKYVAVATNQEILIVDGQTGTIIRTYAGSAALVSHTSSTGTTYFSSRMPASGGTGFRTTAWSPNGQLMASALSFGPSGEIQVWNPQSGAMDFTLTVSGSYTISAVSWSSDGQYIAADTYNTQPADPAQSNNTVMVWKIATRQVVFQHNDYMNSDAPVAWQPHTHNIAFAGAIKSEGNLIATLECWNALTGKEVMHYSYNGGTDALDWSPDGTYLAYASYGGKPAANTVIILDAATGRQVYAYKGNHLPVSVLAWSPNGAYIVSGEGDTQGKMVAKVWLA